MLYSLCKIPPQNPVEIFEQRFHSPYDKRENRQQDQLMPRIHQAIRSDERVLLHDDNIDRQPNEQRRRQIPDFIRHRTKCRQPQRPSMGAHVLEQPSERPPFTHEHSTTKTPNIIRPNGLIVHPHWGC